MPTLPTRGGGGDASSRAEVGSAPTGPRAAFSPTPMLTSWRSRTAEPAPTIAEHQPTEERFLYLLRRSLSKKAENRLSAHEAQEVERVRAKLTPSEFSAFLEVAASQRRALKQLPKLERHAIETQARLRTEMQMLELELRGSDIRSLEAAVDALDRGGGAAGGEREHGAPGAPDSARATRSLMRQLLGALQVERARASRLEQLLAEATERPAGVGPAVPALQRGAAQASSGTAESGGSGGGGAASPPNSATAAAAAPAHAPWTPGPYAPSPAAPSTMPECGLPPPVRALSLLDEVDGSSSSPPSLVLPPQGFSSPLARRVHDSIQSEIDRLQRRTEQVLAVSLDGGAGLDERGHGDAIGRLLQRSVLLAHDIRMLQAMTGSHARQQALGELGSLLANLEGYVASLRAEMRLSQSGAREAQFEAALARQRPVVDVPDDGDCLFFAVAEGLRARAPAGSAPEPRALARELRARCVDALRTQPEAHEAALRECAREALGGARALDVSAEQLRAELIGLHGEGVRADALSARELAEPYCRVRARDGIFGERLELSVLAQLLRVRLRVFYYVPGRQGGGQGEGAPADAQAEGEDAPIAPAEVFDGSSAPADDSAPIDLLCSLAKRHFRLLLPPGAPPPPSASAPASTPPSSRAAQPAGGARLADGTAAREDGGRTPTGQLIDLSDPADSATSSALVDAPGAADALRRAAVEAPASGSALAALSPEATRLLAA